MIGTTERTIEQVRTAGLEALAAALGPSDMIPFLQSAFGGSGDYTTERRRTLEDGSVRELAEAIVRRRNGSGDYTRDRQALLGSPTVDELVREMKAMRANETDPE
jgi:hypothetical protein